MKRGVENPVYFYIPFWNVLKCEQLIRDISSAQLALILAMEINSYLITCGCFVPS